MVNGSKNDIKFYYCDISGLLDLAVDIYYPFLSEYIHGILFTRFQHNYFYSSPLSNILWSVALYLLTISILIESTLSSPQGQFSCLCHFLFICCLIKYLHPPQKKKSSFLFLLPSHQANEFGKYLKWLCLIICIVQ